MNETLTKPEELLWKKSDQVTDPEHPAVIQPGVNGDSQECISYRAFYEAVDHCQNKLQELGVERGDRIVLLSPNSADALISLLAGWRLGALMIPVDFRLTVAETFNVASKVEAKILLLPDTLPQFEAISEKFGSEKQAKLLSNFGAIPHSKLTAVFLETNPKIKPVSPDGEPALAILTSGTTGEPKAALHDLESLMINLVELGDLVSMSEKKRILLPLPLSHIFGLEVACIALLCGATLIFSSLEPTGLLRALKEHEPQIIAGVPLLYSSLLAAPQGSIDLKHAEVLLCGGAPLPVPMAMEFEKKYGKRLNNGYGSTESKIIALNLDGPLQSIGRPVPSSTVIIADENQASLPEGEEGEIIIESDILMQGYLGRSDSHGGMEKNRAYRTGDIGFIKDGYIYISGRAKEMIVVAGNKVFPNEVEEVLLKHPLVSEIAVTGVEHSRLGQIVKATIVTSSKEHSLSLDKGGEKAKEASDKIREELRKYAAASLKRELRPMQWQIRSITQPLPKTASGKIDKKSL